MDRARKASLSPIARTCWLVGGAAAVALVAGLALWPRQPPPPSPVTLADPELLDPAVRRLVTRLTGAIETDPHDPARRARLALAYEANQLWHEAGAMFDQALAMDPDAWSWSYHRALVLREAGDPRGALEQLREIVARRPDFAPAQERLGHALLEAGDLEAALAAFERVVELEPDRPQGYLGAGEAWLRLGDPARALEPLERGRERHPGDRGIRYRLGRAYRALARSAAAERELALGLEAEPSYLPDPLTEELGRLAVRLVDRVERATALYQTGQPGEAARILEECLRDHPENLTVLNSLALARLAQGQLDRARELADRALEIDPEYFETYLVLASWATLADRRQEAVAWTEEAVERADGMAAAHTARAQALVGVGRHAEAAASLERALELESRDPRIFLSLGVLYEALGRTTAARDLYAQALGRWPELPPAQIGLAKAALALGDREEAAAAVAAAGRLAPDHPELPALVARLEAPSQ